MSDEPAKPYELSKADREWLKKIRISTGDLCETCKGLGCLDCRGTGEAVKVKKKDGDPEC